MDARQTEAGLAETRRTATQRAFAISDELRKSARAIRQTSSKSLSGWTRIGNAALNYRQFSAARSRWPWLAGLIGGYVLPALLVVGYLSFWMSSQYTSEARFAVRGGANMPAVEQNGSRCEPASPPRPLIPEGIILDSGRVELA